MDHGMQYVLLFSILMSLSIYINQVSTIDRYNYLWWFMFVQNILKFEL